MARLWMPTPRLLIKEAHGCTRVTFLGTDLTAADVEAVEEHLAGVAGRPLLRLDLTRVEHLSAATLTGLLALDRRVRAARGHLAIEHVGPLVHEVFEVTGLSSLLNVKGELVASAVALAAV
jgi:anti-anti-sigma factor